MFSTSKFRPLRVYSALFVISLIAPSLVASSAEPTPAAEAPEACAGTWAIPLEESPQVPLPPSPVFASDFGGFPDTVDREALVASVKTATSAVTLSQAVLGTAESSELSEALIQVTFTEYTLSLHACKLAIEAAGILSPSEAGDLMSKVRTHQDDLIERLAQNSIHANADLPDETVAAMFEALRAHLDAAIVRSVGIPVTASGEQILLEELYSVDFAVRRLAVARLANQPGFPHAEAVDMMLESVADPKLENWLAQAVGIAGS